MKSSHHITWLLHHEPIDLFVRTAKAFSSKIAELTEGRIRVDVFTMKEYADKFNNGIEFEPVALMQQNHVQMSQLKTNELAKWTATDFWSFDMPYLFRDHDHCSRVIEGKIGEDLLNDLSVKTPVRGLAFTYSGGYYVMASNSPITTAEDLKGFNVVTRFHPVVIDTAKAFGCNTTVVSVRDHSKQSKEVREKSDAIQTTLPRYKNETKYGVHKHVTNTEHAMYLTTIIVSNDFWNQLDDEDKEYVRAAARHSAKLERQWTLEESEALANSKQGQLDLGIESYCEFPEQEKDKLKKAVEPVYQKYKDFFSPGLLDKIINA